MVNLQDLYDKSNRRLRYVSDKLVRFVYNKLDPEVRLTIIYGQRGVGKTTLLLQYLKYRLGENQTHLYASLDNLFFSTHALYEVGDACHFISLSYEQKRRDLNMT